jgi:hypothetical protein
MESIYTVLFEWILRKNKITPWNNLSNYHGKIFFFLASKNTNYISNFKSMVAVRKLNLASSLDLDSLLKKS